MPQRAKTVFITGAGSGIGLATAKRFLKAGWNVTAFERSADRLKESFPKKNKQLACIAGDTRDTRSLAKAVAATKKQFSTIDAVFANAGIHQVSTLMSITEEDLDAIIAVNIKGTINTLKAALPSLQKNGGGAIVINASDQALIGKRSSLGYGLTKGALGQMTRSLALDLAPFNVRVNAVCPGSIETRLGEEAFKNLLKDHPNFDMAAAWKQEADQYPVKRIGKPEEVAGLVYFLCGDEAGFITGSLYPVDGGLTAQ